MADMLVKLYDLPDEQQLLKKLTLKEINIRQAMAAEKIKVVKWVTDNFSPGWASEADISFSNAPRSIFIAVYNRKLAGFACYDTTCRNFFGPLGVESSFRGQGIGKALLLVTLRNMRNIGYAYAIIGEADSPEFYQKNAGAVIIENSQHRAFTMSL